MEHGTGRVEKSCRRKIKKENISPGQALFFLLIPINTCFPSAVPTNNKIFLSFSEIGIIMRIFLVNFIHTSAGQSYNADFVLLTQETFPTSHEIYKRIKSAAVERGLHVHGPILWTGITELNESDEQQFNHEEE